MQVKFVKNFAWKQNENTLLKLRHYFAPSLTHLLFAEEC